MVSVLKRQAKKAIEDLSTEKVKVAVDFLEYLKEKEEMEATLEVLASHQLRSQIAEAEQSLQKGKRDDFIPWEKVKRNV
jgi:hypothetical protein